MREIAIELDAGGLYQLHVSRGAAELRADGDERLSRLRRGLVDYLRVEGDGFSRTLDERGGAALPEAADLLHVRVGELAVATVVFDPDPRVSGEPVVLSPFEARYLADNGFPHPMSGDHERDATSPRSVTDLHTHLAGAPRAEDLIRIGLEAGIAYPEEILRAAGVHATAPTFEGATAADVPLSSLSPEALGRLRRALRLPLDRQSTFAGMEQVYRLRSPITKHPRAFVPMLWQIAHDLAAAGVRYAELSAGEIIRADRLRWAGEALPEIQRATGVDLRFLCALSRHDDWEWDLDVFDRLEDLRGSRLVVGVDFMGHETNSTQAFARQIERVAAWASERRPGFVVRVHAGENPAYPENVRLAVELGARPGVLLRIGHGVFGVDDATLTLMRDRGVIVEVNPSSNFALNNIQSTRELPLVRYLRAGVGCVLGTDGHGIYQTSAILEGRSARLGGATDADLRLVTATEARYLALRDEADARLPPTFAVPDDRPLVHFSPAVSARIAAERQARDLALASRLQELGIARLDGDAVSAWIGGRRCVSIAGAWVRSWPAMPEAERARVRAVLDDLVAGLDPARVVLVTGGTQFGVENEAQARASRRGIPVLGVLVRESPHDAIEPSLAAAAVLGEALHEKAAGLYELMRRERGLCLFFGGGNVVHDEIQTAHNLGLRYLLLAGVTGASGEKAITHPRYAFLAASEALARLDDEAFFRAASEPFWHLGANPTVDAAIFRRASSPSRPGGRAEVLLIRRTPDASAEPDRWALIGGFVHTDAPRGSPFRPGAEEPIDCMLREVREEACIDLAELRDRFLHAGDFEGGGRDERDTPSAWSRTSLFAILLEEPWSSRSIAGGDDACDAAWWPLDALPSPLAFDHAALVARARAVLGLKTG